MTSIIFMGTPQFSVPILEGLVENENYQVLAVVTQPDRLIGRKKILTPTPVKMAATRLNLPVFQPEKLSGSDELQEIIALAPDFIVTAAYGQFLPEKLLQAAKIFPLNVHASLLPKYRGGAPIHYAVINGDEKTGVTIMEMVKKMDAGGIFSQKEIPIAKTDDTGLLFDKLSIVGRDLLLETLPEIIAGLKPVPQDETLVTFAPNITKEQEKINFEKPAKEIVRLIHGLRPAPGAFALLSSEARFKIWEATVATEVTNANCGTVLAADDKIWIACGENSVLDVQQIQAAGKKQMTTAEFLKGASKELQVGMVFE